MNVQSGGCDVDPSTVVEHVAHSVDDYAIVTSSHCAEANVSAILRRESHIVGTACGNFIDGQVGVDASHADRAILSADGLYSQTTVRLSDSDVRTFSVGVCYERRIDCGGVGDRDVVVLAKVVVSSVTCRGDDRRASNFRCHGNAPVQCILDLSGQGQIGAANQASRAANYRRDATISIQINRSSAYVQRFNADTGSSSGIAVFGGQVKVAVDSLDWSQRDVTNLANVRITGNRSIARGVRD